MQIYTKIFNARRAAQRAGIPNDRIEVLRTPKGFVWRDTRPNTNPSRGAPGAQRPGRAAIR